MESKSTDLRLVAAFEAAKGLLVLGAAGAVFGFLHAGAQAAAEQLVLHFHLNPASHYPRIFLELASNLTDTRLLLLAAGALGYALIRFAEAYGLWRGKRWAWAFGLASAGLYVPVEIYELAGHFSWAGIAVLLTNGLILAALWRGRAA